MATQILVIDDDSTVSGLLHAHLTAEGFEVIVTSLGEEGIRLATATPPAAIMLDVQLPDATGFQIVGRLRSNPITREVPIILMTGAARWPSQQSVGKSMGANEYILKPFEIEEVSKKLHALLNGPPSAPAAPQSAPNPVIQPIQPARPEPIPTIPPAVFPLPAVTMPPVLSQAVEAPTPAPAAPPPARESPPPAPPAPEPVPQKPPIFAPPQVERPVSSFSEMPVFRPTLLVDPPTSTAPAIAAAPPAPVLPEPTLEPSAAPAPRKSSSRRQVLVGACLGTALVAAVAYLRNTNASVELPIETVKAAPGAATVMLKGRVFPAKTDTLAAPFSGPVSGKHFQAGQSVAGGDVLAILSRRGIAGDFEAARRKLHTAERASVAAQKALVDTQSLPPDLITPNGLAQDKRQVTRAAKALETAQADYAREEARWKQNRIRAPYSGIIIQDSLGGQKVVKEGAAIAVISSGKEHLFRATVNGDDGTRLHVGQSVRVRLPGAATSLAATLVELHSSLEGNTIVTGVVCRFSNPEQLRASAETDAQADVVTGSSGASQITIPKTAVVAENGKAFVWTVNALNNLSLRPVTLGDENEDRVAITHGLSSGDRYCTAPPPGLKPGLHVKSAGA